MTQEVPVDMNQQREAQHDHLVSKPTIRRLRAVATFHRRDTPVRVTAITQVRVNHRQHFEDFLKRHFLASLAVEFSLISSLLMCCWTFFCCLLLE